MDQDAADGALHRFGTMVINKANIATYKDDLKKITADIQGKFQDDLPDLQQQLARLARKAAPDQARPHPAPAR